MRTKMNNLRYLIEGLGGIVAQNNPDMIPKEILKMVACPFEAVEDAETLEIEGCPSEEQCEACKRKWLKREAKWAKG